jgi:rSAM/selenodomain-associated transferase 2
MISVVIPALNAERTLASAMEALVPAAISGMIKEVIVVDGGSTDATSKIADQAGADIVSSPPSRSQQLSLGAKSSRFPWILFLHADTLLQEGWEHDAGQFMRAVDRGDAPLAAGVFKFRLNDTGLCPRTIETLVRVRCATIGGPCGQQGMLIPRRLFNDIGGFKALPIMEDVDLFKRLGRGRIRYLKTPALSSAEHYRSDGYIRHALRNQACLAMFKFGLPPSTILKLSRRAEHTS